MKAGYSGTIEYMAAVSVSTFTARHSAGFSGLCTSTSAVVRPILGRIVGGLRYEVNADIVNGNDLCQSFSEDD
jgi:hypothetical protein